MNLLLDTHTFLWWMAAKEKLSDAARLEIASSRNQIAISSAVAWEIVLKAERGKLSAPPDLALAIQNNRFSLLPITLPHVLEVRQLPPIHTDPFDRLLIAQARTDGLTLVTRDATIPKYEVPVLAA
jgi:PIN domain nuclease of toxin-antitoxin system